MRGQKWEVLWVDGDLLRDMDKTCTCKCRWGRGGDLILFFKFHLHCTFILIEIVPILLHAFLIGD